MNSTLKEAVRLYQSKRWDVALKALLDVDLDGGDQLEAMELAYYLGLCYTKLSRYEDAMLYLEQVITSDVDPLKLYQCRMALAFVYALTDRNRLAEFELKKLLDAGYESVQLWSSLAYTAWKQKRAETAVSYYEKALGMDDENPNALNGLGFILCDTELDVPKGMTLCRRAVDARPKNPAYLDSLGWALYKGGHLEDARIWLRRALDIAPREEEILAHLKTVMGEG